MSLQNVWKCKGGLREYKFNKKTNCHLPSKHFVDRINKQTIVVIEKKLFVLQI